MRRFWRRVVVAEECIHEERLLDGSRGYGTSKTSRALPKIPGFILPVTMCNRVWKGGVKESSLRWQGGS